MSDSLQKLPLGWENALLADVATLIRGVTYKKEVAREVALNGYLPLLRATNITGSALTFEELVYVPKSSISDEQILQDGDVVIASSSGSKEVVGKAGQFHGGEFRGSFGAFCTSIRPQKNICALYIGYYCQSPNYRKFVSDISAGSNINNIKSSELAAHLVPVPPRNEQTRIVEKLEELLSDLDAGVAELKAAQKKLAQYRQSLLKTAVEGALTAEWRKSAAAAKAESGADLLARILRERRARWEASQLAKFKAQGKTPPQGWQAKYPEPVAPDTTDLPELPEGWAWATIDQFAQIGTGVTPLRSKAAYFKDGTIPWVTSGALNDETVLAANERVTELALKECRLEIYPAGALLVAMYGEGKTRGKCSELAIAATINQAIAAIVLEPEAQNCKAYLKAFLLNSYERMREQASGGVQPNLNLQIVKSILVPLPPVVEQREISRLLQQQFEQLEQQQQAVHVALRQSSAQRKNILETAFSGQLVPQDPTDEPASVLLDRIRAERANRQIKNASRRRAVKTT